MEKKYHYWEISITEYFKIIKGGEGGSDQYGDKRNDFSLTFLKGKTRPINVFHLFA